VVRGTRDVYTRVLAPLARRVVSIKVIPGRHVHIPFADRRTACYVVLLLYYIGRVGMETRVGNRIAGHFLASGSKKMIGRFIQSFPQLSPCLVWFHQGVDRWILI